MLVIHVTGLDYDSESEHTFVNMGEWRSPMSVSIGQSGSRDTRPRPGDVLVVGSKCLRQRARCLDSSGQAYVAITPAMRQW